MDPSDDCLKIPGDPGAQGTGQAVVEQSGHQNARHDGQRLFEAGGQNEGQQLGLVANFSEGDHTGRDEQRFHGLDYKCRT